MSNLQNVEVMVVKCSSAKIKFQQALRLGSQIHLLCDGWQ